MHRAFGSRQAGRFPEIGRLLQGERKRPAAFSLGSDRMGGLELLVKQANWLKPAWMLRSALSIQEKSVDNLPLPGAERVLKEVARAQKTAERPRGRAALERHRRRCRGLPGLGGSNSIAFLFLPLTEKNAERSEERRVGKECRSRWSPYH